ncbi:MAG: hypothetical protein NTY70_18795 [Burkholderiales bacterium]|nr:hypothetical protein [Burkholderiales bacterium]
MKIIILSKKNITLSKFSLFIFMMIIIMFVVIIPRLMVAGGLPVTDEGAYAYQAQLIHASLVAGKGVPDSGGLMLYPLLTSWVFGLTGNHIVLLRLLDMLVATVASILVYRVIERESASRMGGAMISLLFIFTMHHPLFIQSGFKNSIFAAYVPLFLAVLLADKNKANVNWFLIGALVGLATLLREPFLIFLIIGVGSIAIAYDWRASLNFIVGAAILGGFAIFVVAVSRGGLTNIIHSYLESGIVYSAVANQRAYLFMLNGLQFLSEARGALVAGALGLLIAFVCAIKSQNRSILRCLFFWITVSLAPLIEPVTKIGFPYHFAVCLPGLAGVASLGWKSLSTWVGPKAQLWMSIVLSFGMASTYPQVILLFKYWPDTLTTITSFQTNNWPQEFIEKSNYLIAAEAIRKVAPPDGTLGVSGFMFALYPLTGLLPVSNDLSNLSATLIQFKLNGLRLKEALIDCPPDVLMTTTRTDWPGADILRQAVIDSGLYVQIINIPVVIDKAYGNFGGDIYVRINKIHPVCKK